MIKKVGYTSLFLVKKISEKYRSGPSGVKFWHLAVDWKTFETLFWHPRVDFRPLGSNFRYFYVYFGTTGGSRFMASGSKFGAYASWFAARGVNLGLRKSIVGIRESIFGSLDLDFRPKRVNFRPLEVYFWQSETFHTRTAGRQSSLKDGYHIIHGRGTPL